MTDRDAFLARIIANPDDNLPRLVYADWLDEQGECDRAEFIRVQCELAKNPQCITTVGYPPNHICDRANSWNCGRCLLMTRERELWKLVNGQFTRDRSAVFNLAPEFSLRGMRVQVRRGFVSRVSGPLAAFWEERECRQCNRWIGSCGDCKGTGHVSGPTPALVELVRREPVTQVDVTDKDPFQGRGNPGWWYWEPSEFGPEPSDLPEQLWRLVAQQPGSAYPERLCRYDSEALARGAISKALVESARS